MKTVSISAFKNTDYDRSNESKIYKGLERLVKFFSDKLSLFLSDFNENEEVTLDDLIAYLIDGIGLKPIVKEGKKSGYFFVEGKQVNVLFPKYMIVLEPELENRKVWIVGYLFN